MMALLWLHNPLKIKCLDMLLYFFLIGSNNFNNYTETYTTKKAVN